MEIKDTEFSPDTLMESMCQFRTALNKVMSDTWIQNVIADSANTKSRIFKLDQADELAAILSDKLPSYIATINIADEAWRESLIAWCHKVSENQCKNTLKHKKVEKKYEELVIHQNSSGRWNSQPVISSIVPTPEDELVAKEEAPIWEARAVDIRLKVRRIITEDMRIAELWSKGHQVKEIAAILNKPEKTIYGKLERMLKAVIQEIGIVENSKDRTMIKEGLRELFGSSLRGLF